MHFFVWRRAALLVGAAVGAFAGCCVTSVGIARAAEATDICLALAKNVKSDVNIQGSIQQKFLQMQHLVGADIYASYSAAKDTKINADSDIAAYVDFVLETTSSDFKLGREYANRDSPDGPRSGSHSPSFGVFDKAGRSLRAPPECSMVDERLEPSFRLTKEVVKLHVIWTRLSLRLVRTPTRKCQPVAALSARCCSRLRLPTGDRIRREPHCQAPAITQGCIIFAPIRDPMTLAGNVASALRMKLERHDPLPT